MEQVNILLCEDEKVVAKYLKKTLEDNGYHVTGVASSAEEAMQIIKESETNLAIMDINLQGEVPGTEVANILKNQYAIPSIFLSAYADDNTVKCAKKSEPLGYLVKPFRERELLTTIETGIHRFRKEKELLDGVKNDLAKLKREVVSRSEAEEEQISLKTKRNSAYRNILNNVNNYISKDIEVIGKELGYLCTHDQLPLRLVKNVLTAYIHYEYVSNLLEQFKNIGDETPLEKQEKLVDDVIQSAMGTFSLKDTMGTVFVNSFYPTPININLNQDLVEEALTHLFFNASVATISDPIIYVKTTLVSVKSPQKYNPSGEPGWYAVVEVTDYGRGIDELELDSVVEPFYTKSSRAKWGLGLSFVDGVMQRHGGWMTIDSSLKKGTNVKLFFPENLYIQAS
jgi:CheY-like chemotaxis protein